MATRAAAAALVAFASAVPPSASASTREELPSRRELREWRWQDAATGAFRDDGAFAHLFVEALLELDERLGTARFRPRVLRALAYLHDSARDPEGRYPKRWEARREGALAKMRLLDQASAARAFLAAARAR